MSSVYGVTGQSFRATLEEFLRVPRLDSGKPARGVAREGEELGPEQVGTRGQEADRYRSATQAYRQMLHGGVERGPVLHAYQLMTRDVLTLRDNGTSPMSAKRLSSRQRSRVRAGRSQRRWLVLAVVVSAACGRSSPTFACGDGELGVGEACDDGNYARGDGCDERCRVEESFGCVGSPSVCLSPPLAGRNLLVNADAEADQAPPGFADLAITGWDDPGAMTVAAYGQGDMALSDPGPSDRGVNYFVGGRTEAAAMTQAFDLEALAMLVDRGELAWSMAGYLGGWTDHPDQMRVALYAVDATENRIQLGSLGPVTAEERGNRTGIWLREADGRLPAGARSVVFEIVATRFDGNDNDGYADNLSLAVDWLPSRP